MHLPGFGRWRDAQQRRSNILIFSDEGAEANGARNGTEKTQRKSLFLLF
jgi:hypothetical protein